MKTTIYLLLCLLLCHSLSAQQGQPAVESKAAAERAFDAMISVDKEAPTNKKINEGIADALDDMIDNLDELKDAKKIKALRAMKKYIEDNIDDDPATVLDKAAQAAKKAVKSGDKIEDAGINDDIDKVKSGLAKAAFGLLFSASSDQGVMPRLGDHLSYHVLGTGRTTGHIADLIVTNSSDTEQAFSIPPGEIPPTDGNQRLLTSRTVAGTAGPMSTSTFPIRDGFCIEPSAPVSPNGSTLTTPTDWEYNTTIVRKVREIVRETSTLIVSENIDISFTDGPKDAINTVSQIVTWAGTPYGPVHPEDVCERIIDQIETATGTPYDALLQEDRDVIDREILETLDAVETVGQQVGIPYFQDPTLPDDAYHINDAPPSTHPEIAKTIKVISTGRTTGHIADLTITNLTDKPVTVVIGPGDFYIPMENGHQPILADEIPPFTVGPGETVTTPVIGICGDKTIPVTPEGAPYSTPSDWVGIGTTPGQTPDVPTGPGDVVHIPTKTSMPVDEAVGILEDLSDQSHTSTLSCIERTLTPKPLIPGTDKIIPVPIDPVEAPGIGITLSLNSYKDLKDAYISLVEEGDMQTVFSGDRLKEGNTFIQWGSWIYNTGLKGGVLEKTEWDETSQAEVEAALGVPLQQISEEQQNQITVALDDLWSKINVNVKFPPTVPPAQETPPEMTLLEGINPTPKPGETPPSMPGDSRSNPDRTTAPRDEPPIEIQDRQDVCQCGDAQNIKVKADFEVDGKEEHFQFPRSERSGRSTTYLPDHQAQTKVKTGSDFTLYFKPEYFDLPCKGQCQRRPCEARSPDSVRAFLGTLDPNGSIKKRQELDQQFGVFLGSIPDVEDDLVVYFTVYWTCKNGIDDCDASCHKLYYIKLDRAPQGQAADPDRLRPGDVDRNRQNDPAGASTEGQCSCQSPPVNVSVEIDRGRDAPDRRVYAMSPATGDGVSQTISVQKRDRVSLIIVGDADDFNASDFCSGCSGECKTEKITAKVTGVASPRSLYSRNAGQDVTIPRKTITRDTDIDITLTYDCEATGCRKAECELKYRIRLDVDD